MPGFALRASPGQVSFKTRVLNEAWWRRWESNPRPRNSGRRFLRVQPAGLSRRVVSQSAPFLAASPKNLDHRLRARRRSSPSDFVALRPTGRASRATWLLTQPERSCYRQL